MLVCEVVTQRREGLGFRVAVRTPLGGMRGHTFTVIDRLAVLTGFGHNTLPQRGTLDGPLRGTARTTDTRTLGALRGTRSGGGEDNGRVSDQSSALRGTRAEVSEQREL